MLNFKSAYVVAHGTRLHYYRTGNGEQPLVLVHGITDDSMCWASVAKALSDRFDIFMVDMRGHGKSEAPESGYRYENLAKELASFIQELGLEKPTLIGHSMGAATSLTLAGMFPDLPRAVVLVDPPGFWSYDESDPKWIETRKDMTAWIHSIKRKTKEELFEEARTKNWSEADRENWVNAKQRVSFKVIELITPPDIHSLDFPSLVSQIKCPVLLLQGDLDQGAICSEEDINNLRTLLPPLQTVHIPKATHSIHRSQFAPFMKAVDHFLYRLYTN